MRLSSNLLGLAAVVALAGFATSANATISTYNFTLDGLTSSPLPSEPPYWGSFTVNDNGGTTDLTFDVVLNSSLAFYFQDDNPHPTGTFMFLTNGTVTSITNIATSPVESPVGFVSLGTGTYTAPSIIVKGDATKFNQALSCATDCQGGKVQDKIYELKFDVLGTDLSLAGISDSKNNPGIPIYGAADVAWTNSDGQVSTGNIGATAAIDPKRTPVPEPASWAMMLAGLFGTGWMLRRGTKDGRSFAVVRA